MTTTQPVKFGYNWGTSSIPASKAIPAMRAANASAHLMMVEPGSFWLGDGDIANIKSVLQALPNCLIIVRIFSTLQGDWKRYPAASEYESHWRNYKTKFTAAEWARLVWDDPVNEPMMSADNTTEFRAYVDRCVKLVEAAGRVGMKFAVGAWSVGTPHERWFETELMPLWRALAANGQGISAHAYGTIPSMAGETLPIALALDPAGSLNSMTEQRVPLSHAGWLIVKMYRVIKIFEDNHLGVPEIYITEGIIDNIYNSSNSAVKEQWRSQHGDPAFNRDPRGPRSFHLFLNKMFAGQNKTFSKQLAVIHRWARRNIFYHPAFKAVCLFALNFQWDYKYAGYSQDGQHKEAGANYDRPEYDDFRNIELPAINAEIIDVETTPPPVIVPAFDLFPAQIKSFVAHNIRAMPDQASQDIGDLPTVLTDCEVSKETSPSLGVDTYQWLEIKINGLHGWVGKTNNIVVVYKEVPAPVRYRFVVGDTTFEVSLAEQALLLNVLGALTQEIITAEEI